MWDVVTAGVFVLAAAGISAWLVEGGVRRRARLAIKEELELAQLSSGDVADAFRASAARRAERYVTPFSVRVRRATKVERGSLALAVVSVSFGVTAAVALAAAQSAELPEATSDPATATATVVALLAIGASAGFIVTVLRQGLFPFAEGVARFVARFVHWSSALNPWITRAASRVAPWLDRAVRRLMYGRRRG